MSWQPGGQALTSLCSWVLPVDYLVPVVAPLPAWSPQSLAQLQVKKNLAALSTRAAPTAASGTVRGWTPGTGVRKRKGSTRWSPSKSPVLLHATPPSTLCTSDASGSISGTQRRLHVVSWQTLKSWTGAITFSPLRLHTKCVFPVCGDVFQAGHRWRGTPSEGQHRQLHPAQSTLRPSSLFCS